MASTAWVRGAFDAANFCSKQLTLPQDQKQEPNADFKPNLVNTICFLVQFIIQLMTFAVNYQVCSLILSSSHLYQTAMESAHSSYTCSGCYCHVARSLC